MAAREVGELLEDFLGLIDVADLFRLGKQDLVDFKSAGDVLRVEADVEGEGHVDLVAAQTVDEMIENLVDLAAPLQELLIELQLLLADVAQLQEHVMNVLEFLDGGLVAEEESLEVVVLGLVPDKHQEVNFCIEVAEARQLLARLPAILHFIQEIIGVGAQTDPEV